MVPEPCELQIAREKWPIYKDAEVVRAEHALALAHALPHAKLAILPGGHGEYIGEICAEDTGGGTPALVTAMIEAFLK